MFKQMITFAAVAGLVFALAPAAQAATMNHWWKLYETSGTTAVDSVAGMNGNLTGNPVWQDPGLEFDGSGDYVNDLDNMEGALPYDGFTLTMWFTPDNVGDWRNLFNQREQPDDQDDNRSKFEIYDSLIHWGGAGDDGGGGYAETDIHGITTLTVGHQYFAAVTYSHQGTGPDDLFMYLGDVTAGDTSLTQEASDDFMYTSGFGVLDNTIGAFPNGDGCFDGVIVDVRTYAGSSSSTELEAIFDAGPIPEPATMVLLAVGSIGFLMRRRRM